jgi:hypothetical protein
VTDRIRTGPVSLASSRAEPLTLRSPGAFPRCRPGHRVPTKDTGTPIRKAGNVLAGLDSGPACIPFHHEREPPPGVEPGRPPYEGGAASRARRHELPLVDSNHD